MDNERGCGLDCGEIAGSLMETSQSCREHARSGHMLTWTSGPEPAPEQGGNGGLTSAQQRSSCLSLTLYQMLFLSKTKSKPSNVDVFCLH